VRVTEAWEPRKWLKRASAETAAAQYAELSSKLLALPRRGSACGGRIAPEFPHGGEQGSTRVFEIQVAGRSRPRFVKKRANR
jgi:hypothetical protein